MRSGDREHQEELKAMRKELRAGLSQDRLDDMLRVNAETLAAIKKGLVLAEDDLARASRSEDTAAHEMMPVRRRELPPASRFR